MRIAAPHHRIRTVFPCAIGLLFLFTQQFVLPVEALSQADVDAIYNWPLWNPSIVAGCGGGGVTLSGSDNLQKAFNFFASKGLTSAQIAGIIGNLEQESGPGMNPGLQENGSNSPTPVPGVGFGIAQWTTSDRQQGLQTVAKQQSLPVTDLGVQLTFLWDELTHTAPGGDYTAALTALKAATDVASATESFERTYEAAGVPVMDARINYAQAVFALYGNGPTAAPSSAPSGGATSQCAAVNCQDPSNTPADLSPTRQRIVCIAQGELALWQQQPGYPHPAYAATGFLKYSAGWYEEWCADFTSWVYQQAGVPFTGGQAGGWMLAGVSEIQAAGEQGGTFHWHSESSGYTPRPGDLAIHNGQHVNIFISAAGGVAEYIGGDQGGGPYGHNPPLEPGSPTPSPPSGSIVSIEKGNGYYDDNITGYVSPD